MIRRVGAFVLLSACLLPASAGAYTLKQVTAIVRSGFTHQIAARAKLANLDLVGTTTKCAPVGPQEWTCLGTYTVKAQGEYLDYGIYISATDKGWQTVGTAHLVKSWF